MKRLHVLIVCTGNICRSPFAAVVLREKLAEAGIVATVASCGTSALEGNECPETAVLAAERRGYDLSEHRARLLDHAVLEGITHAIAMDASHLDAVSEVQDGEDAVPWAESWDVEDPYGGNLATYRACFELIEGLCDDFVAERQEELGR